MKTEVFTKAIFFVIRVLRAGARDAVAGVRWQFWEAPRSVVNAIELLPAQFVRFPGVRLGAQ
jgi:hypothetical protein